MLSFRVLGVGVCVHVFSLLLLWRDFSNWNVFKNIEKEEESLRKTVPKINQNH